MISKDLMEEVLGIKLEEDYIPKLSEYSPNFLEEYWIESERIWQDMMSVYELSHLCKIWTKDNSDLEIVSKLGEAWFLNTKDTDEPMYELFKADPEYASVFQATQWIYERIKGTNGINR